MLAAVVMLTYGTSFFINSIASRVLTVPSTAVFIMLNSGGRATALAVIGAGLWQAERLKRAAAGDPPFAFLLTRGALYPAAAALCSCTGFIAYLQLIDGGEVSVLTPMICLYSVIPVIWALARRGEERTRAKYGGIFLSAAAVLVLAFSGQAFDTATEGGDAAATTTTATAPTSLLFKITMFAAAFVLWGAADTISSGVKVDPIISAFMCAVAHGGCAMIAGWVSYAAVAGAASAAVADVTHALAAGLPANATLADLVAPATAASLGASQAWGWGHVIMLLANATAITGWLAFVRLGQVGQASVFIPVVSLYVFIPVALSIMFLGEALTLLKGFGILLAGAAVLLLSKSWGGKGDKGTGGGGGGGGGSMVVGTTATAAAPFPVLPDTASPPRRLAA